MTVLSCGKLTTEIWDKGNYSFLDNNDGDDESVFRSGLRKGHVKFKLHGKKLKGEFVLIKTQSIAKNSYLLIKQDDKYAVQANFDAEEQCASTSPINKILKKVSGNC